MIFNKRNTTDATSGAETGYPSRAHAFLRVVALAQLSFSVYYFVDLCWLFCTFSFPHYYRFIFIPDLSYNLWQEERDGCYWWSRNWLPFRITWVSPFLVKFLLLNFHVLFIVSLTFAGCLYFFFWPLLWIYFRSWLIIWLIFNRRNKTDATSGAETDYRSWAHVFPRF